MSSIILLSGGIDSTVVLADCLAAGERATGLFVDYGQRHRGAESSAAAAVAAHYGIALHTLACPAPGGSALLDPHADLPTGLSDGHPGNAAAIVPGRNLLLIALAAALAEANGAAQVRIGCHAGDSAVFPDCRPAFLAAADTAVTLSSGTRVRAHAPFATTGRPQVITRGAHLQVPFTLTWSCYTGGHTHCGHCGACTARRAAFTTAGVPDPTGYAR